jgi:hypothetical protein
VANKFSGDANCVALYTFENDWPTSGVLDDEKGSNDMTDNNTVTRSEDEKEGTYSADCEYNNSEYFSIADANLDSGFPGKSGEANPDFSVCFWIKAESSIQSQYIVAKYDVGGKRVWGIRMTSGNLIEVLIGYDNGDRYVSSEHAGVCVDGQWYHVGIIYDNDGGGDGKGNVKTRIWDDNAGAILQSGGLDTDSDDLGQQMSIENAAFCIGAALSSGSYFYGFDGIIDEVVIFKDLLTTDEIDQIRQGIYGVGEAYEAEVSDGLSMGEILLRQAAFQGQLSDGLTGSDVPAKVAALQGILSDGLSTGDVPSRIAALLANILDGATMGDAPHYANVFEVEVLDGLNLGDTLGTLMAFLAAISDGFKTGDITYWFTATGELSITLSARGAKIEFRVKVPGIDFTARKPGINFQ